MPNNKVSNVSNVSNVRNISSARNILASTSKLWLLDTNILSAIIKNPTGMAATKAMAIARAHTRDQTRTDPGQLVTSVVVECELAFGAQRVGSTALLQKISQLLQLIAPQPFGQDGVAHYANIRTQLQKSGTPMCPNDTFIAAHALALGATLVTDNEAEFRRVPGLQVENWLR